MGRGTGTICDCVLGDLIYMVYLRTPVRSLVFPRWNKLDEGVPEIQRGVEGRWRETIAS